MDSTPDDRLPSPIEEFRYPGLAKSVEQLVSTLRVSQAQPLEGFWVRLVLTDGTAREIDLEPFLKGPVFAAIRSDRNRFLEISVDAELGTIVWPNGADICPDVLIHGRTPADLEESSPSP